MWRTVVFGASLLALMATAPAHAGGRMNETIESPGLFDNFMWHRIEQVNESPSLARYLINECVIASVGAMAITAIVTGPVAPAAAMALGTAGPGLTLLEIGVIGCGGGIAAGVASVSAQWAWEEQDYIRDVAEVQIAGMIDQYNQASADLGNRVAQVWSDPVAAVQTTVAAVADGAASLLGQGGQAAGSAVQVAAATMSGWWFGQNRGVDDFVTYETASIAGLANGTIAVH